MDRMSISSDFSDQERVSSSDEVKGLEPACDDSSNHRDSVGRSTSRRSISNASRTLSRISRMVTGDYVEEESYADEDVPNMGNDREYPPSLSEDNYLVTFDGDNDPAHPFNWPLKRKLMVSVIASMYSLCNSMSASEYSQSSQSLKEIFHVGNEVATLATCLYVLGFAFGPIIWAPLSELYGRKFVFIPSCFGFSCFSFAVATAKDLQTIMICRFFAGCFGGSGMVLAGSVMGDMFAPRFRGRAMVPFGLTVCVGPLFGPIIGGFTVKNEHLGWRWNAYWSGILGAILFILMVIFLKETYHPVVLAQKAALIRKRKNNWAIHSAHEVLSVTWSELCVKYLIRPMFMLSTEPVLLVLAIYGGFVYGLIFMLLEAIPIVFEEHYHFIKGVGELPYISVAFGTLIAGIILFLFDIRYRKLMGLHGKPMPEERLLAMMVGGISVTIGLFWFFWTGNYSDSIHWIVPTIGGAFIGIGSLTVIQPCMNYVVDLYGSKFGASGLAALSFMRAISGSVFPLFARPMFLNLHLNWSGTLLGCVSILLVPMPFLFYFYGKRLRQNSKLVQINQ